MHRLDRDMTITGHQNALLSYGEIDVHALAYKLVRALRLDAKLRWGFALTPTKGWTPRVDFTMYGAIVHFERASGHLRYLELEFNPNLPLEDMISERILCELD